MNYNLDLFSGGNSPIEVKRKSGAFSYKQPSSDMASTAALQKVATANPSPPVKPAPQTTSDTSPVAGQASKQESQSVTVGRRKLTPLPISTPPPPKDAKARTSLNQVPSSRSSREGDDDSSKLLRSLKGIRCTLQQISFV